MLVAYGPLFLVSALRLHVRYLNPIYTMTNIVSIITLNFVLPVHSRCDMNEVFSTVQTSYSSSNTTWTSSTYKTGTIVLLGPFPSGAIIGDCDPWMFPSPDVLQSEWVLEFCLQ